ncbi:MULTISPECIES: flavin reductase family protein [Rhizobium]|uniref:flavin reductase family protein n=1 Tax=Rhizobium TaxID=379 RepID=UPI001958C357|nr:MULTISPECIES: flavin reductase family protein [Rhizobium]MBM7044716.1 flavin reductase family protein [Rhizobium lusitanum]
MNMPFGAAANTCIDPPLAADDFRAAMREFAAGVTVVTTLSKDGKRGLTATAVCSLSAEPSTLLACINRDSDGYKAICESGFFCVNVLAAEQSELASRFAGRDGIRGERRFDLGDWENMRTGAPALADALAVFDCRTAGTLDWGSHTIFIGSVVAARVQPGRPGLVYRAGSFYGA